MPCVFTPVLQENRTDELHDALLEEQERAAHAALWRPDPAAADPDSLLLSVQEGQQIESRLV